MISTEQPFKYCNNLLAIVVMFGFDCLTIYIKSYLLLEIESEFISMWLNTKIDTAKVIE
jgi:hypothetical protein